MIKQNKLELGFIHTFHEFHPDIPDYIPCNPYFDAHFVLSVKEKKKVYI